MSGPPPSIWFLPEVKGGAVAPTTPALAAEAGRLAAALGFGAAAFVLGREAGSVAATVPAGTVFVASGPSAEEDAPAAAAVLECAVRQLRPTVLLFASSPAQREVASRLAARLGTGLAPACLRLEARGDGAIQATRNVYGGRASCTVAISGPGPQVFTLAVQPSPQERLGPPGRVVALTLSPDVPGRRIQVLARERVPPMDLELEQARVIVAGGRGAGGPEAFRWMERLAGALGGAVAASRPAVDNGWAPPSRQVGSSGKTVAPSLYIACGISGANQHLVGMRGSEQIVVINTDPHAPLVKLAQLALIGDAQEVLAACCRRLEAVAGAGEREGDRPGPGETAALGAGATGPIRIGVCVSAASDPELPQGQAGAPPAANWEAKVLNPADLNAIEEALRMGEAAPAGSRVYAIALGPPQVGGFLRQAMAMGVDGAFRISGPEAPCPDSLVTARLLAAAVRRLGVQAVLCGLANPDGNTGQVPVQIAELLGWELVRGVTSVQAGSESVLASCLEDGATRVTYRVPLPAVLALMPGANRPRYAPLRCRLAARGASVEEWSQDDLGLAPADLAPRLRIISMGPPKPAVSLPVGGADESSVEDRLRRIMGGGSGGGARGPQVVHGPPERLAEEMVRFLVEHGFVAAASHKP